MYVSAWRGIGSYYAAATHLFNWCLVLALGGVSLMRLLGKADPLAARSTSLGAIGCYDLAASSAAMARMSSGRRFIAVSTDGPTFDGDVLLSKYLHAAFSGDAQQVV